jgi:hypothetical protein
VSRDEGLALLRKLAGGSVSMIGVPGVVYFHARNPDHEQGGTTYTTLHSLGDNNSGISIRICGQPVASRRAASSA